MKKVGLFLMALALVTTALVSTPVEAAGPFCGGGLACLIGPVCCSDLQCAGFCQNLNPGSIPHCSGNATEPGCCSCDIEEAGL